MAFRNLISADRGAIRTLTINRPDKLNALNRETINELSIAFDQARHDDSVRVVVLAGAGEKAFVAGADIAELEAFSPVEAQQFSRAGQRMMRGIELLGKPVIARIQGFALGGGLELAMCCHLRIGSDKARLGLPEITLGLGQIGVPVEVDRLQQGGRILMVIIQFSRFIKRLETAVGKTLHIRLQVDLPSLESYVARFRTGIAFRSGTSGKQPQACAEQEQG